MRLQIMLERHSDSQIPRNIMGGKQGNAMTVTVSQMILSALECCGLIGRRLGPSSGMLPLPPPPALDFANHIFGLDQESCTFCKQNARRMQHMHRAKGGFPD